MSGDRAGLPRRTGAPPAASWFSGLWKPLGFRSAALDLPGLSIKLDGMDETWWTAFLSRYGPFARDTTADRGAFTLTLSASRDTRRGSDYFITPPEPGEVERNPLFVAIDPGSPSGSWGVRACTYRLAASFSSSGGRGLAVFAGDREDVDPRDRAVENILRVAIAWCALARGGLLIHAASIVDDGVARLFFGRSGAGKSTLAAGTRRGQVVSDDLTLVIAGPDGRPEVVGTPFRGTFQGGAPTPGRWPLKAAFRLRKTSTIPAVESLSAAEALGDAVANLPFVVDQLGLHPELFEPIEKVLGDVPIRALSFRKEDDSWWQAVDAAGL